MAYALEARWDRAEFGVAMRRIEVLLSHGKRETAERVFQGILDACSPQLMTLESHVGDCLPTRTAELLERAGYQTLRSVGCAADEDLLSLPEIGPVVLREIRQTIDDARRGRPRQHTPWELNLYPDWELTACQCHHAQEQTMSTDKLKDALATLLVSAEEGVEQIDAEIAELSAQIESLRRVRKLLGGSSGGGRSGGGRSGPSPGSVSPKLLEKFQRLNESIAALLGEKGPLSPSRVAESLGTSYSMVGRAVKRSEEIYSDGVLLHLKSWNA